MADNDKEVNPLTTSTVNYGWVKPDVGGSDDAWGGLLNTDLDGIDNIVHGIDARPPYVLPTASTTILGGVKADGTTIHVAGDGTISTFPVVSGINENRIINGDMRIDQRNNGASGTANGYTVDRWQFQGSLTTKGAWRQNINGAPSPSPYGLVFTPNSAYSVLAGDYFCFNQVLEADTVGDFNWGTVGAQPVTLSFYVYSTVAGTFGGAIRNVANTRTYPFSYVIATASTWTKIAITIPGDTTGTWVMSGNAASMGVIFDLGSGASNRATAGAWAAGNYLGATGTASILATNGASIVFTSVKLEIGSVATPFNRQSLAKSMADCQRYYQKLGGAANNDLLIQTVGAASTPYSYVIGLSASMRAVPTVTPISMNLTNCTSAYFPGLQTISVQLNATAAGPVTWTNNATSSYVTASAEL